MMKRLVIALLGTLAFVMPVALSPSAAFAADNVIETYTDASVTSLGNVTYTVRFDDTNCNAHTTVNCSGANGAKITYIDVKSQYGAIDRSSGIFVHKDEWGDNTSNCKLPSTQVFFNDSYGDPTHMRWTGTNPWTDVRRVRVAVFSNTSPWVSQSYMINPFSYEHTPIPSNC